MVKVITKFNKACGIYRALNVVTNKSYIGSSVNIRGRICNHLKKARAGSMTCFHRAIREYGEGSFYWEIVALCVKENLVERERHYISHFNSASVDGYNTVADPTKPQYGYRLSDVTRQRISAAAKGRKMSESNRLKLIAANTGRIPTPQARQNMSNAQRGRKLSKAQIELLRAANTGRVHSPETRAKMSLAKKGVKKTAQARANMSAAQKGKQRSPQHVEQMRQRMIGHQPSAETRARMSASGKARRATAEVRARMSIAQFKQHADKRERAKLHGI